MFSRWLSLLLVVVLVAPTVQAVPKCESVTAADPGAGGYYLVDAGTSYQIWRETNGVEGLQKTLCKDPENRRANADARLMSIPTALALRGVPP